MSTKTVLITGCSTGIGRACATRLAARGHTVYASARHLAGVADLESSGCRTLQLDVTDEGSMRAAVEHIESVHGAIDVLVNNAGYSQSGAVETVPVPTMKRQFDVNVFGPARLIQLSLPAMRARRRGLVINMSSMGGRLVLPGGGVYHASKYALEALTDALRFEVAGFGIDVVLIEPGLIKSSFARAADDSLSAVQPHEGPYAPFHSEVGRITRESYVKGSLAPLVRDAEAVAQTLDRVLRSRRPRARYVVGPSATFLLGIRRLLPDRLWDAFLARTYPRPGALPRT